MHASVQTVVDHKRGCGYRKEGGLYLMGGAELIACGKLPIPLTVCPYCGSGIHITRSLQKINLRMLTENIVCSAPSAQCDLCLATTAESAYLMSVGEKFYKTPADFLHEAMEQGISKRIHAIPRDFKVGESIVALAHKKGMVVMNHKLVEHHSTPDPESLFYNEEDLEAIVPETEIELKPAIFSLFRPTRIEYVCKGDETDDEIEALLARGITPVMVVHAEEQIPLPESLDVTETQPEHGVDALVTEGGEQ